MSRASWTPPPIYRVAPADETESVALGLDGTRLFVRRRPGPSAAEFPQAGEGGDEPIAQTIVFCDGVACDGFIWKYLWDDLASVAPVAHWHYRGHGRSAPPRDPERIDVTDFATDLDVVRRHLGDPPVVLIGHSFGVQVVLEGYRLRPEGVAGVVLCCGAPGKVTETFHGTTVLAQVLPKIVAWVNDHPELARAIWSRLPIDLSLKMSYLMREVDVDNMRREDLLPYLEHMTHMDFGLFMRILSGAGAHTAEELLPHIAVPALVIAAERDTFTPPDLAARMASAIPGGEILVLKNGSHAALIEQPALVRERIFQFLRGRVAAALRPLDGDHGASPSGLPA